MNKQNEINVSAVSDGKVSFSAKFVSAFPQLSVVLQKAYFIDMAMNSHQRFRQYIWTNPDGTTCGWLCRLEHCVPQGRNIIPEHALLTQNMGGIVSVWQKHGKKNIQTFLDTTEQTFSLKNASVGIEGWEERYRDLCKQDGVEPLDTSRFVTFALEDNGNATFYDCETKEVFYFAHDGYSPFDIKLVDGQPEYTIHRFTPALTFTQFVEQLAKQWQKVVGL